MSAGGNLPLTPANSRPLRVLHLTSSFPRSAGGPGGSFLEDLARSERAAGLGVTVVAPHDAGLGNSEEWGAISVRRFR